MLYDMRIFDEPILVKVLTLCPETLVAVGGGGGGAPPKTGVTWVAFLTLTAGG